MEDNRLKIATPISDLFNEKDRSSLIIKQSDCLECRDHTINSNLPKQELFHCELQPIHEFGNKEIKYLERIKLNKPDLKLISFHLASCYKNPLLNNGKFHPRGEKISRRKLISNAKSNFVIIKKIFKENIMIAVENNNHYNTEAYDYITSPKFISQIVNYNKINFLFDIAHAKISSHNMSLSYEEYKNKLPMNRLIQIHIAKPGFNNLGEIYDKHDLPKKKEINETINLIKSFPYVKYITVEYYKNFSGLVEILKHLKFILN